MTRIEEFQRRNAAWLKPIDVVSYNERKGLLYGARRLQVDGMIEQARKKFREWLWKHRKELRENRRAA